MQNLIVKLLKLQQWCYILNCNIYYRPTPFQSTQRILDSDWENAILRENSI